MNLLEAIQSCGDNWFRPFSFKGSGEAYFLAAGNVFFTSKTVRMCEMNSRIDILTGEWEIVTPEQVMKERQ